MRFLRLTTALLALSALAAAPAGASVDVRGAVPGSYDYDLSWHPAQRVLTGSGELAFSNAGPGEVTDIWLRMRPNSGDGLERVYGVSGATIAERRAGGSMLRLRLDAPVSASGRVGFRFRLSVPGDESSLGRSAGADLFGDALPVLAIAGPGGVRIGPEPSFGEGSFNSVADWTLRLKTPRGLRAVMPGAQRLERRTRWSSIWSSSARVRDAAFAVGRFSSRSTRVGQTRVSVWGASAAAGDLPVALDRAVNAFRTLDGWYGHYDLPTLKVIVGDLPFGGSEYPGLVFSTPDNGTIAHEVAHQWFYGIVGNDQYRDPFLDESLTAYAEQEFHHSYRCDLASPLDGRTRGLATGMDYWQDHPDAYQHTIYRGGACALTVLRRDIGETAFRSALRAYVDANAGKIAAVQDFLDAVHAAAPDYDLARWERLVGMTG